MSTKSILVALVIAFFLTGATCQKKDKNEASQNEDSSSQVDSDSDDNGDY